MHTPGPWAAISHDSGRSWDIHHKSEFEDGGYFGSVESLHWTKEARETAAANARLIAAAPALLSILQRIHKEIPIGHYHGPMGPCLACDLEKAIASATAPSPAGVRE